MSRTLAQRHDRAALVQADVRRASDLRLQQRYLLEPAALAAYDIAAGLDAGGFQLIGNIVDNRRLDCSAGAAALEGVR